MNSDGGSVSCALCQGRISVLGGDLARLKRHLELEHSVFSDKDIIIAIGFLEPGEREVIVEKVLPRIRAVLDNMTRRLDVGDFTSKLGIEKRLLEESVDDVEEGGTTLPKRRKTVKAFSNYDLGAKDKNVQREELLNECEQVLHKSIEEVGENRSYAEDTEILLMEEYDDEVLEIDEKLLDNVVCDICSQPWSRRNIKKHKIKCNEKLNSKKCFDESLENSRDTPGKKTTECNICQKTMLKTSLKKHVGDMHVDKFLEPEIDLLGEPTIEEFGQNENSTNTNKIECDICHKVVSRGNMARHKQKWHVDSFDDLDTTDQDAKNGIDSSRGVEETVLQEPENESDTKFTCDSCPKQYSSIFAKQRHMQQKHNKSQEDLDQTAEDTESKFTESEYTCDHCPKQYSSIFAKQRHMQLKHDKSREDLDQIAEDTESKITESEYTCDHCPKQYSSLFAKQRHMQLKHDKAQEDLDQTAEDTESKITEPEYTCDHCPKQYSNLGNKQRHMKLKHTETI